MLNLFDRLRKRNGSKAIGIFRNILELHIEELSKQEDKIPDDLLEVSRFILEEQRDASKAMLLLLKKGHYKASFHLARSILESSINLQYIYASETDRRARNYCLFPMKTLLRRSKDMPDSKERSEMASYFNEKLKMYHPTGDRHSHWDGKSIREIFCELNKEPIYDEWYSRLSGYTHQQYKGKTDFDIDSPYIVFLKKLIMRDIVIIGLETLKSINDKYDLVDQVMWFHDYPEPGATFFFSVNPKRSEIETKKVKGFH